MPMRHIPGVTIYAIYKDWEGGKGSEEMNSAEESIARAAVIYFMASCA